MLGKIGADAFDDLLVLMEADDLGKRPEYQNPKSFFDSYRKIAAEIIESNECFSLKNLAVSGDDLISVGLKPGKEMGAVLKTLLEKVIEGEIPNEKEKLLNFAKNLLYNVK